MSVWGRIAFGTAVGLMPASAWAMYGDGPAWVPSALAFVVVGLLMGIMAPAPTAAREKEGRDLWEL